MTDKEDRNTAPLKGWLEALRNKISQLFTVFAAFAFCGLPGLAFDLVFGGPISGVPSVPSLAISFCMGFIVFHRVLHWLSK